MNFAILCVFLKYIFLLDFQVLLSYCLENPVLIVFLLLFPYSSTGR